MLKQIQFQLTYRREALITILGGNVLLDGGKRGTSSGTKGLDGSSSLSSVSWHFDYDGRKLREY